MLIVEVEGKLTIEKALKVLKRKIKRKYENYKLQKLYYKF